MTLWRTARTAGDRSGQHQGGIISFPVLTGHEPSSRMKMIRSIRSPGTDKDDTVNTIKVRDVMVPISDYATVKETATLYEAVKALEDAQESYEKVQSAMGKHRYKHRAVVVLNEQDQVVGKLSMWDVIRALEPQYDRIGDFKSMTKFGFSGSFIRSMLRHQGLWQKPLDNLCEKASAIKVKDIMYTPAEGEFVEESATLDEGIHQLIMGHHQSLLVIRGADRKVVGVLRLTDVFEKICDLIKTCAP